MQTVGVENPAKHGDFPKIWGTILGVPIIRFIVFWGLYWGPPILGNYHMGWCGVGGLRYSFDVGSGVGVVSHAL